MRRLVLALAATAALLGAGAAAAAQKSIKDPAEYNAYITALNTADPAARAAAMDAFLKAYPSSIMVTDALEQEMAGWQQAGDAARVEETARRLIAANPTHVRALAILAALVRQHGSPAAADEAGGYAERGVAALKTWTRPEEMSEQDYATVRGQMIPIFAGALGYRALNRKDYVGARPFYLQALANDPGDLSNAYQLAIADLEGSPQDVTGFWWAARAMHLAESNLPARNQIETWAKARYQRYHGGLDGWDQVVAQGAKGQAPPASFGIARAPTAAELAVKAVRENDPASLSLGDWAFVLNQRDASPENKAAAEKVWNAIQARQQNGKARFKLQLRVRNPSPGGFDAEVVDDGPSAQPVTVRVHLRLGLPGKPIDSRVTVTGVFTTYNVDPFKFHLEDAAYEAD